MTQKIEGEPEIVVIRRYGNRRLYDTRASCYVNLSDIRTLVREGRKIQVLDAKTDEDVTRRVLTQIVLESAETDDKGLPLDLLYELARASDRAFRDFLDWYLRSSVEVYRNLQERWQEDARRRWGEARPAFEAWAQLWDPRQVAASLAQLLSPFDRRPASSKAPASRAGTGSEPRQPSSPGESVSTGNEIAELRRRLDELEHRLEAERVRAPEESAAAGDADDSRAGGADAARPRRS